MLSLHVIVPVVLAVAVIAGAGAFVYKKNSHAQILSAGGVSHSCGDVWRRGTVYYSAVGTASKFASARDSDSIRNIASKLCAKGFMTKSEAIVIMNNGNYTPGLKSAYHYWQTGLGYSGSNADGVPGPTSLKKLGLVPSGF